jgi:hypothetical protein
MLEAPLADLIRVRYSAQYFAANTVIIIIIIIIIITITATTSTTTTTT